MNCWPFSPQDGSRVAAKMNDLRSFFNVYSHNFVRVAVAIPQVHVADPLFNADHIIAFMREAAERKALLVVFPELGVAGCQPLNGVSVVAASSIADSRVTRTPLSTRSIEPNAVASVKVAGRATGTEALPRRQGLAC